MSTPIEEIAQVRAQADCLYSEQAVEQALDRMAIEIASKLADSNPLVLCVMVGGLLPTAGLLSRLDFPLHIDYIHATRYRGETSGGELEWRARPSYDLSDRTVLIVDDILDEGLTLQALVKDCLGAGAKEVLSAVLVEKMHNRKCGVEADFMGLQVEDRYVFGYGMDYKGYLRNAPGIFAVKSDG
ncbi:MAG: hypoxanthine-guanine phosphoribosyltransferase [Gammaproteobacteria bacterium]|nr:hypoxanthine-guanine phosphoribosyltransferase [Gammaproteobacteria bacterium]